MRRLFIVFGDFKQKCQTSLLVLSAHHSAKNRVRIIKHISVRWALSQ